MRKPPPAAFRPRKRRETDDVIKERRRRMRTQRCYECCQGRGSRRELWDRLCPVCHKLTRALTCHGYMTMVVNPRVRVPRLTAKHRWAEFLKKYPRFALAQALTVEQYEGLMAKQDAETRSAGQPVVYAGDRLRQKAYLRRRSLAG